MWISLNSPNLTLYKLNYIIYTTCADKDMCLQYNAAWHGPGTTHIQQLLIYSDSIRLWIQFSVSWHWQLVYNYFSDTNDISRQNCIICITFISTSPCWLYWALNIITTTIKKSESNNNDNRIYIYGLSTMVNAIFHLIIIRLFECMCVHVCVSVLGRLYTFKIMQRKFVWLCLTSYSPIINILRRVLLIIQGMWIWTNRKYIDTESFRGFT